MIIAAIQPRATTSITIPRYPPHIVGSPHWGHLSVRPSIAPQFGHLSRCLLSCFLLVADSGRAVYVRRCCSIICRSFSLSSAVICGAPQFGHVSALVLISCPHSLHLTKDIEVICGAPQFGHVSALVLISCPHSLHLTSGIMVSSLSPPLAMFLLSFLSSLLPGFHIVVKFLRPAG